MNDNRVHAHTLEQHDVSGKRVAQRFVNHGMTAVLNHNDLTRELLNIRQGFDENVCMLNLIGHIHATDAFLPIWQ
jgi:hypothetical protein